MSDLLDFRPMNAELDQDVQALFSLLERAPGYSDLVEGRPASVQDAHETLAGLPPGKHIADKLAGGYYLQNRLVGCLDLIRGYPANDTAYIGLLLFAEDEQGKGLGVQALAHVRQMAQAWHCSALRLAVVGTNTRALAFWAREGFREVQRRSVSRYAAELIVMQRPL